MNCFERIRIKIPDFLVSDSIVKSNLELQGIASDSEFKSTNLDLVKSVYLAYAECLKYILRLPTSISQGGFSMSAVDKEQYQNDLIAIFVNYGMDDELEEIISKPDITNAGEWY